MKKFSFRLETYRQICLHMEEVEEIKLGDLLRHKQELQAEIEELRASLEETYRRTGAASGVMAAELHMSQGYILSLREKIDRLKAKELQLEEAAEKQRVQFMKAAQRRQVVDKLRDKELSRHQAEAELEFQQEIDELWVTRSSFSRKDLSNKEKD